MHPLPQILYNCLQFLLGQLKYSVEIKTKGYEKLCGEGINKVYHRRCANGEQPISWHYEVCIIVFNFSWDYLNTSRKKNNKGFTKLCWGGGGGSKQGVLWKMRKWRTTNFLTWLSCSAGKYQVFSFVNLPPPPIPRERQHKIYLILKPLSHCIYFLQCMRRDTIAFWCSRNQ